VTLLIAQANHPKVNSEPPPPHVVPNRPTSTGISTKASTATPPTPSTRPEVVLTWKQCGRDATDTVIKEGG